MNVHEAMNALRLGWVAEGTNQIGHIIRFWAWRGRIRTVTCDGDLMQSIYACDTHCEFVVRPETREEMRERLARAGFGGE